MILGLILVMSSSVVAQNSKSDKPLRPSKQRKIDAANAIQNLKKGVLLVCLHSDTKRIAALKEKGFSDKAEKIAHENDSINEIIMETFSRLYDFSSFYFFDSKDLVEIKSGNFEGKIFDSKGVSVQIPNDTSHTFILETRYVMLGDMGSSQLGLAVCNHKREQLQGPFPYYVRKREALGFQRRDHPEMIHLLDEKLEDYHNRFSN